MNRFRDITEHFNPAWFAAIMGTAVIPLVLSSLNFPGRSFLAMVFLVVVWTLVFVRTVRGIASGEIFRPAH